MTPSAIVTVEVAQLRPDPGNVRVHPPEQVAALAARLRKFGQQSPVVVVPDESNPGGFVVMKGNGVLMAARAAGWTHLKCVVTALSGNDLIAWSVADNASQDESWFADDGTLEATMRALAGDGYDVSVIGLGDDWGAPAPLPVAAGGGDDGGEGEGDDGTVVRTDDDDGRIPGAGTDDDDRADGTAAPATPPQAMQTATPAAADAAAMPDANPSERPVPQPTPAADAFRVLVSAPSPARGAVLAALAALRPSVPGIEWVEEDAADVTSSPDSIREGARP